MRVTYLDHHLQDYSDNGDAWSYFPFSHAKSRAYRWNEDGIAGWCNRFQNVCLSPAFWNTHDPFLKARALARGAARCGERISHRCARNDSLA